MRKDLILVALLVMTLTLMAVPLNQGVIDALLALNISLAVIMLMVAIYLKRPSDFSTFPSVILIGTSFRLALSIGTTRLILSDADAGQIIETFGDFVVSGSVAIGLVIFLIITVVQFLVITKGAERVAEVGARFALDALPGKQMSIDAEMRAGNLTVEEGRHQRSLLDKDSQFFGAMDGAMKFIKGDAIAGLIIICINLVGGIIVGITIHGLSPTEAVGVFSLLTIGDGLVSQFPALLMSLCAGILVTRVSNNKTKDLGSDIAKELVADSRVPTVAAGIVFAVGMIPGFPTLIFSIISVGLLVLAQIIRIRIRAEEAEKAAQEVEEPVEVEADGPAMDQPESLPVSDRFIVTITQAGAAEVDVEKLEDILLKRFWTLYSHRGVRFPRAAVVVSDDPAETPSFTVSLDEVPLLKVELVENHTLLSETDFATYESIFPNSDARKVRNRILNGHWVPNSQEKELSELGIVTMLHEELISHIAFRLYEHNVGALFNIPIMETLLESLRETDPNTMEGIEEEITQAALLKMFLSLIEDGVPLRPTSLVISSLHYWIHNADSPTPLALAECMRSSMKRQLCHSIARKSGVLGLALLDPAIEIVIRRGVADIRQQVSEAANDGIVVDPETTDAILDEIRQIEKQHKDGAYQVALVVSADLRRRMRNFLALNGFHLPVLAPHEVSSEIPSFPIHVLKLELPKAA